MGTAEIPTVASSASPAVARTQIAKSASSDNRVSKWMSEGMVIAATPVAAYFVAFAYYLGRAHFFGIPPELVTVDLKMFVLASTSLMLIPMVFVALSLIFFGFWPHAERDNALYRRIAIMFPNAFLAVMLLIFSDLSHWYDWLLIISPMVPLSLVLFVVPLSFQKDKSKSVSKRFEDYEKTQRHDSVFDHYVRHGAGVILLIGVWLYIIVSAAFHVGMTDAERQTDFFVRSTSPETVVLSMYGDYAIAAKFNREKKTVERKIMVVKVTGSPTVTMQSEHIGPLRPE